MLNIDIIDISHPQNDWSEISYSCGYVIDEQTDELCASVEIPRA